LERTYVVLDDFIGNFQSSKAFVLNVFSATRQRKPFPSAQDKRFTEFGLGDVVLDREGGKSVDLDCSLEVRNVNDGLDATDSDGVGRRSVDEVDAVTDETVDGNAVEGGVCERLELESAYVPCDGAFGDEDVAGNHDGVEMFEGDLFVGNVVLDGGECSAVFGVEPFEEDLDRGKDMSLFFCLVLFGCEVVSIRDKAGVESQDDFRVKLEGS
jgi:hypothetical protein